MLKYGENFSFRQFMRFTMDYFLKLHIFPDSPVDDCIDHQVSVTV